MEHPGSRAPRKRWTWREAVLPAVFLVPLVAGAAWLCADSLVLRVWMPLQLNYVEGFNVDDASRLARGEALYGDPSRPPYVVSVYTPGFTAAVAAVIATGVDGLAAARLVQFLCVLGIASLIVASGSAKTGWIALAAGLFFLLDPIQPFWQVVARPDAAATLLAIAGIATLERRRGTGRRDAIAAALFAASILTKQSFLAAPAASFIFLSRSNWKRAWRFAALLAAFCALPAVAIEASTHGEFLWHTVVGNANPFAWARAAALGARFWSHHLLELALLLAILLSRPRQGSWSLTALWAAIASVLSTVTMGKMGSGLNYFIEPMAAIALLAARELPPLWESQPAARARVTAGLLAVCGAVSVTTDLVETVAWRRPLAAAQVPYRELMAIVAGTHGLVVSDDACLLVHAHRAVHIQPFVMTGLAEAGRWDQRPFLVELANQQVKLIVAQVSPLEVFQSRYTPEMRRLIAERYVAVRRYVVGADYAVFVPATHR